MATADVKIYTGTPIVWDAAGTNYAFTLASLTTTATAAWQGVKGDLTTPRGARMLVRLQTQFVTNGTPAAGEVVEVYWAGSPSSTAGTDNPGGATGTNAAYTGVGTGAQSKRQLQFVGALVLDASTGSQVADVGVFTPIHRYGMPVVCNLSTRQLATTTTAHVLTVYPIVDQIQASA